MRRIRMAPLPELVLAAMLVFTLVCKRQNHPPDAPVVAGPNSGFVDSTYTFTTSATDPDGDSVSICFDWGDSNMSEWSELRASGEQVEASHSWHWSGSYQVRAKAKDCSGSVSQWSPGHTVNADFDFPSHIVDTIENVHFGEAVYGMAVLPAGDYIYVSGCRDDYVHVISTQANEVVDRVRLGPSSCWSPDHHVAAMPNGEYVYATWHSNDYVAVIRTSDNTIVDSVRVPDDPCEITALPNGESIYVHPSGDDRIFVISTSDNSVVDSIAMVEDEELCHLAALPTGEYVYAATAYEYQYVIRTSDNIVVDTASLGIEATGLAACPDGHHVYIAGEDRTLVVRVPDNAVEDTVLVDGYAFDVAATPDGKYVYVCGENSNEEGAVFVFRTMDYGLVHTITLGSGSIPNRMVFLPDGSRAYVAVDDEVVVLGFWPTLSEGMIETSHISE